MKPNDSIFMAMVMMRELRVNKEKTNFLIHLLMFPYDSSSPKTLLFFIIRDHLGKTSLSDLQKTLYEDLKQIWAEISKVGTWVHI